VIVADLGAGERLPHLAGIAASNVEKGEGLGDGFERGVEDLPDLLVREGVGVHQFLIGGPLCSSAAASATASPD
jgi:hypothetical protein